LEKTYKSFARNGAALPADKQELYRQYTTELGEMTLKFGQNSLAATNAFTLNITDPGRVEELPDFVKEGLAADAKARGEKGWTVTLQYPSYVPFMTYSSDREAKEQLWRASNARALGGEFDNCENIRRIVDLRRQIAGLLGYETYADYVLEAHMAENTATVNAFLQELLDETIDYVLGRLCDDQRLCPCAGLRGRCDAVGLVVLCREVQEREVCAERRAGEALLRIGEGEKSGITSPSKPCAWA